MNTQLFIPEKIKVGFQKRDDTYTKQLAYVIYYDEKGKLRKEASWKSWRDDKIEPKELKNEPTIGFVLNKGVQRYETQRAYIRVWDPRGFEFEISIANLLFILTETDCGRKGLEGEFVYCWDGKDLVLLPVGSQEYKASKAYTDLQSGKIITKDLVDGCIYEDKFQNKYTYLGKFNTYLPKVSYEQLDMQGKPIGNNNYRRYSMPAYDSLTIHTYKEVKKHIFINKDGEVHYADPSAFRAKLTDVAVSNYAELVDKFTKTNSDAAPPVRIELRPYTPTKTQWGYYVSPLVKLDKTPPDIYQHINCQHPYPNQTSPDVWYLSETKKVILDAANKRIIYTKHYNSNSCYDRRITIIQIDIANLKQPVIVFGNGVERPLQG